MDAVAAFIDQVLEEDRRAPRKQRHTARRIYRRILTEFPDAGVAESTVRNHVRARKRALGLVKRETFVPQSYALGHEAQVDWYEAWADLGGERTRLQVFAMRSMASGAAFHRAYLHATQQAFLEAHEHAFAYFGGVFRLLRYDYVPGHIIGEQDTRHAAQAVNAPTWPRRNSPSGRRERSAERSGASD